MMDEDTACELLKTIGGGSLLETVTVTPTREARTMKRKPEPFWSRFSCRICGKMYTSEFFAQRHELIVHKIKVPAASSDSPNADTQFEALINVSPIIFRCSICNIKFPNENYKRKHELQVHNIKHTPNRTSLGDSSNTTSADANSQTPNQKSVAQIIVNSRGKVVKVNNDINDQSIKGKHLGYVCIDKTDTLQPLRESEAKAAKTLSQVYVNTDGKVVGNKTTAKDPSASGKVIGKYYIKAKRNAYPRRVTRRMTAEKAAEVEQTAPITHPEVREEKLPLAYVKPFRCGICDMLFSLPSLLAKHVAIDHHIPLALNETVKEEKESPSPAKDDSPKSRLKYFRCNLCPKFFRKEAGLEAHKKVCPARKHRCNICSDAFGSEEELLSHKELHLMKMDFPTYSRVEKNDKVVVKIENDEDPFMS